MGQSDYQPSSRRPIADLFRLTAKGAVALCARWRIHPDTVSYASVVAALLAGGAFAMGRYSPWCWLLAPLACYLRLWCNMLDGMVALATGQASRRGEILNDLPDRVSDIVILVGVAHSGLAHPVLGYWAALLAVMTAYVGTLGQAVAGRREYGGLMAKPWRMVLLHLGAWVSVGLAWRAGGWPTDTWASPMNWALALIILGCLQTCWVRLAATLRRLAGPAKEAP